MDDVCVLCQEPMLPDERLATDVWPEVHRECGLRSVIGGIEHLTAPPDHAIGTCYEGSTLTYRESAKQAWDWFQAEARKEKEWRENE